MGFIDNISAELARLRRENDALRADLASIRSVYDFAALEAKIAEPREALKFAKDEFQCLRHWLDRAEAGDYKYRDDPALSGHRRACIDAATVMGRALEQKVGEK